MIRTRAYGLASNGACTTYQCEQLLRALRWATHPDRGDLRFLVLMVCFGPLVAGVY
jgi:hypothetical protein